MEALPPVADRTVGELVAEDYRRARIFKRFGIEFCCGGGIPLKDACERRGLNVVVVAEALQEVVRDPAGPLARVNSWTPRFLVDYIVSVHHTFVRQSIPPLRAFTEKVAKVHGHAQPELVEIAARFETLAAEMEAHMAFEEEVLFPAIRNGETLSEDILRAEDEHETAGGLMNEIRELTSDFTPPDWACNTYRAAFVNLSEFERDLHVHVHLENNVLFPKVSQAHSGKTPVSHG